MLGLVAKGKLQSSSQASRGSKTVHILQGDFELENYPIPEKYFSCPIEELFELLGSAFVRFARRHNRWVSTEWEENFLNLPCTCTFRKNYLARSTSGQ